MRAYMYTYGYRDPGMGQELLAGLGVACGADPLALRRASNLAEQAVGHPLPSRVRKAGPPRRGNSWRS